MWLEKPLMKLRSYQTKTPVLAGISPNESLVKEASEVHQTRQAPAIPLSWSFTRTIS